MKTLKNFMIFSFLTTILFMSFSVSVMPGSGYHGQTANDTHNLVFDAALELLYDDGHDNVGDFMTNILQHLKDASAWEDTNLPCVHFGVAICIAAFNHYMDWWTHIGLLGFESAGTHAENHLTGSVGEYLSGDYTSAYRSLGGILHLLQDMTVPQHSTNNAYTLDYFYQLDAGHIEYEQYVNNHDTTIINAFKQIPEFDGIYTFPSLEGHYHPNSAWGWLDFAGHMSAPHLAKARSYDDADKRYAADILLPLAVQLTAGFMKYWYDIFVPNKPSTPIGPSSLTKYSYAYGQYSFYVTHPHGNGIPVTFQISWGDGSTTTVSGTSGSYRNVNHFYFSTGTKYIKVSASDDGNSWSPWSNYKVVSISAGGGSGGGGCNPFC